MALVLAPIDAINAVTHVPILVPSITNSALSRGMMGAPPATGAAMVTTSAVIAADDWNSAVHTIPISMNSSGKLMVFNTFCMAEAIVGLENASPIIANPTNIRPKPAIAEPTFLTVSFLKNIIMIMPTNASNAMYELMLNPESAIMTPVNVVPMFAPIIMDVA